MNPRRKFNLLSVLGLALLLIVAQLALTASTSAKDIPFQGDRHNVDSNFEGANSIYAADIDADGDLDMLATAFDQNDVVWWENENGDGSNWDDHTVAGAFGGARAVYAADMDGDGDLDILGAAQTDGDIKWWENGNDWNEQTINDEFAGAHSLLALDMDGDGDMDVVAAALDDNQIAWWENGDGLGTTWTEHLVADDLNRAPSVYAADLDGDGDIDIVAPSQLGNELFWWQNSDGNGTEWTKVSLKEGWDNARAVFAADIDNDGQLDIVAVGDDDVLWWENEDGDGSDWNENTIADTFEGPTSVYATDIDFDGDVDVMASGRTDNEITWWENQDGSGGSWVEHTIDDGFGLAEAIYAADIDSDGDIDLLGAASGDDDVAWWENDTIHRNAAFVAENKEQIGTGFDGAAAAASADLDGDGDLDVLGAGSQNGDITWWQNNGDGGEWESDTIDNGFDGARSVIAADLDGDSDLDVLAAASDDDDISWWENEDGDASDWIVHDIEGSFNGARSVYAADIDADGDMDVLGAAFDAQDVIWWENDGTGQSWTTHIIDDSFDDASAVMAGDIDKDGDLDILAAGDDNIRWWENGAEWAEHSITSDFNGAQAIAVADIDGDGNLDVVGAAGDDNQITWWENDDSDGTDWDEQVIQSDFSGASSVTAADVDQDGDMDVIGSASSLNTVSWWENLNGNGQKWSLHTVDNTFSGASHVSIGDINDDGKPDILAAAVESDEISWYPNQGGQVTLATTATAPGFTRNGSRDDVLKIVATHNGESADRHAELVHFQLFWQQDDQQPLSDTQANALVETAHIYLDTGSGIFEGENDGLVASIEELSLTDGVMNIEFTDGDANVELEVGQARTYFVVIQLTANASAQSPNAFNITHLPNNGAADDRDFDIPLDLSYQPNVSDRVLAVDPASLNYLYLPLVERE